MKGSQHLTESIGSTRSEAHGLTLHESNTESEHVSAAATGSNADERLERGAESVAITIKSSTGYEDAETFTLRGRKATNAFARRLMTVALRAYDKRDDDAGE